MAKGNVSKLFQKFLQFSVCVKREKKKLQNEVPYFTFGK